MRALLAIALFTLGSALPAPALSAEPRLFDYVEAAEHEGCTRIVVHLLVPLVPLGSLQGSGETAAVRVAAVTSEGLPPREFALLPPATPLVELAWEGEELSLLLLRFSAAQRYELLPGREFRSLTLLLAPLTDDPAPCAGAEGEVAP